MVVTGQGSQCTTYWTHSTSKYVALIGQTVHLRRVVGVPGRSAQSREGHDASEKLFAAGCTVGTTAMFVTLDDHCRAMMGIRTGSLHINGPAEVSRGQLRVLYAIHASI